MGSQVKIKGVQLTLTIVAVASLVAPLLAQTRRRPTYTEFPHSQKAHQQECSVCHKFPSASWKTVRPADQAFPDITEYPEHQSCVGCHKQQFFRGAKPNICSICHVAPSPKGGPRHPFPNPREAFDLSKKAEKASSDWAVAFPHDKHIEIVSRNSEPSLFRNADFVSSRVERKRMAEESCSVCHQTMSPQGKSDDEFLTKPPANNGDGFWIRKGMFKSSPLGHKTCFTCHSSDTGIAPEPQNCAGCHKAPGVKLPNDLDPTLLARTGKLERPMREAWSRRASSGVFRHEHFAHADLSCSTCHSVETMKTNEPATTRVSISSCATCHATATLDDGGALNYEADMRSKNAKFECVKCHLVFGRQPIPSTHLEAIKAAGK
mgnify:CR=1 FL=1